MATAAGPAVSTLASDIERAKFEVAECAKARAAAKSEVAGFTRRHRFFKFLSVLRAPARSTANWSIILIVIASSLGAIITFVAIEELVASLMYAILSSLGAFAGTVLLISQLLNRPTNGELTQLLVDTETEGTIARAKLKNACDALSLAQSRLGQLESTHRSMVQSGLLRRQELLQRNWRAMRDHEWEEYLAEVCVALGAKVQRTGRSGDQGVDLIVEIEARRVAVQAKGYYHAVSGSAIQEAVAGVAFHKCHSSAVITNSRFTKGAISLAESNRCRLIGEDEFPDFVLGKVSL